MIHALVLIASVCVSQDHEALKPIDVRSTVHVEGVVVDEKGQAVEGVEVLLMDRSLGLEGSRIRDRTRTDGDGRFSVEGKVVERPNLLSMRRESTLDPELCLSKPGFALARVTIKPEWLSGEQARVELSAAEALPVRVFGPDGEPVAGATVSARVFSTASGLAGRQDLTGSVVSKTDSEGRARLNGLKLESQKNVIIESQDYGKLYFGLPSLRTESGEKVLRFKPAGRLVGRVMADDPAAARDVEIWAYPLKTQDLTKIPEGRPFIITKTDAEGRFEIPALAADHYRVETEPPKRSGYFGGSSEVTVEPGKTAEVSLELERGVLVRGQVRERESGRPLFGARVLITTLAPKFARDRPVTDEAGWFLALMRPGQVHWGVFRSGEFCSPASRPRPQAEIPDDAREFDLPPVEAVRGQPVQGLVVDEFGDPTGPGRIHALWVEFPETPDARVREAYEPVDALGRFALHAVPPDARLYLTAQTEEGSTGIPVKVDGFKKLTGMDMKITGPYDPELPMLLPASGVGLVLRSLVPALPAPLVVIPGPGKRSSWTRPGTREVLLVPDRNSGEGKPRVFPNLRPTAVAVPRLPGPASAETPLYFYVPVYRNQVREFEGRVVDTLGRPVEGAEVFVSASGTLEGTLKWSERSFQPDEWPLKTDAQGRFRTPRHVPVFLGLCVSARGPGNSRSTTAATFAPTTPSFFDIEIPPDPRPDEKAVWERVQAGYNAYNNAAFDEARGRFAEALDEAKRLDRKTPLLKAYLLTVQASAMIGQGGYDEAKQLYQKALESRREVLDKDDPRVMTLLNDMAYMDKFSEHYKESTKELFEVLRWGVRRGDNPIVARSQLILGDMESWPLQLLDQSEEHLKRSQQCYERIYGPDSSQLIGVLSSRALNQERDGSPDRAEPLARRAVEIADKYQYARSPSNQAYLAALLDTHARLLEALGRKDEAKTVAKRAKILKELRQPGPVQ